MIFKKHGYRIWVEDCGRKITARMKFRPNSKQLVFFFQIKERGFTYFSIFEKLNRKFTIISEKSKPASINDGTYIKLTKNR